MSAVAGQTIYPYTDLLLHDMGEGLADGATDFDASGREWRTPPLWGIGLVETVNGHTMFLHDGRARNLTEAILWHGGEAAESRESFRGLTRGGTGSLDQVSGVAVRPLRCASALWMLGLAAALLTLAACGGNGSGDPGEPSQSPEKMF